jgi:hypothetical protein
LRLPTAGRALRLCEKKKKEYGAQRRQAAKASGSHSDEPLFLCGSAPLREEKIEKSIWRAKQERAKASGW